MKLARKLALALFVGIGLILVVEGLVRVAREVALFETDMRRDHALVARALGAAVSEVWSGAGEREARRLVTSASTSEAQQRVRLVYLDVPAGSPDGPRIDPGPFDPVTALRAKHVEHADPVPGEPPRLYTYVRVANPTERPAAIEVSESLRADHEYVAASVLSTALTTVALILVSGALAGFVGLWFVGRPVRALVAQARRVGIGDFSGRLVVKQHDEIRQLADEMNAMSEHLAETTERLAKESTARLAAIEQLRHADRLNTVGKLASGIAHELGTPLNVVGERAKMIATGEVLGDEAKASARVVVEQSARMAVIIRQLMDFARRRGPHKTVMDLVEVSRRTLAMLEPLAEKRRVTLVFDGPAEPLAAGIDAMQVQQALTNLVVNGMQSMERGGTLTVRVAKRIASPPADRDSAVGEHFAIDVVDEGSGIAPEDVPHVFEPFFTTKEVGEGTGLGLSVTYGIVREHGGWIDVASEPGRGSCFTVYLPQERGP